MERELNEVSLSTLGNGAVEELFGVELKRVLENIADPNADARTPREVTVKIRIKPNEDRSRADVTIIPSCKLAPLKPHGTYIEMYFDGTCAKAFTGKPLKQPVLPGIEGKIIEMEERKA